MSLLLLVRRECVRVDLRLREPLLGEELVDARGVLWAAYLWLEWHLVLFPGNGVPIHVIEEWVLLQVGGIRLGAQPPGRVTF